MSGGAMGQGVGAAFAVPEFRVLWLAELLSVVGDQLARVALAVLVYGRTGSALWAAATYALTFVPALAGGMLLSGIADRFPRRSVMVVSDLVRAGLLALMAVPDLPLWALCGLVVLLVLAASPHTAAQGALLPQVLPGALYERGLAIRQITGQAGQLAGFAAGGALVAALTPTSALVMDAVTFVVSAVLVTIGVKTRPRAAAPERTREGSVRAAFAALAADPRRRLLLGFAWLIGWYVVPEALAAPYADIVGAGPTAVGLLMAADPLGSVVGAWAFVRFVPEDTRERWIGPLAVAAGAPLLATLAEPGVAGAMVLWGLSGLLGTAYLVQVQASYVRATSDDSRGRAIGIAAAGTVAGQGVAMLVGGLLAEWRGTPAAIVICAAVGMVIAVACAMGWRRRTAGGPTGADAPGPP